MKLPRSLPCFVAAAFLLTLFIAPSARANTFDGRPKILIHVGGTTAKNQCAAGALTSCADAVTDGGLAPAHYYFAYLVAEKGNLPTLGSFDCGITYQDGIASGQNDHSGLDIFSWEHCGAAYTFSSPNPLWPAPGSSAILLFNQSPGTCSTSAVSVSGYFYLGAYSADVLRLTKRPVDNKSVVYNCAGAEFELNDTDLGWAGFSEGAATPGCNPCLGLCEDIIPAKSLSWSGVKALYAR